VQYRLQDSVSELHAATRVKDQAVMSERLLKVGSRRLTAAPPSEGYTTPVADSAWLNHHKPRAKNHPL
jgi:hypothetical protein